MSNILIVTVGSRGDIQPYAALGLELVRAGHQVTLQTLKHYRPFVDYHRLGHAVTNNEFMKIAESVAGNAATEGGTHWT